MAGPPPTRAPTTTAYPLFLAGMGSWFTAWGLQNVLCQWLLVEKLGESAERVGIAQMSVLIPALLFLLVGGAVADRIDRRRALIALHTLAAVACASFGALIASGGLTYPVVIVYALVIGTLQAFVVPTRDAQLSDVVQIGMSRAVAGLTMVQHAGQGLGALAAGLSSLVGAPPMFGLQGAVLVCGSVAMLGLPRASPRPPKARAMLSPRELRAGLVEVMGSPVLRAVMLLNVSVGLVFVGTYLVLLPLLVRELYGGGAVKMGLLAGVLPLGSIVINLGIILRGGIYRQGRSLLIGQGFAGLCLGAMAFGLPFWGAVLSTMFWGVGAAFAINASRTLFQEHASEENRGRVLSVYSLAILGTGPLGAFLSGFLADRIGTLSTLAFHSAGMTILIVGSFLFTSVRRFR